MGERVPHLLIGEEMRRAREAQRATGNPLSALEVEGVRLEKLLDLTRHIGFPVLVDEFDAMLSAAIASRPDTPDGRSDREGVIRALDMFRHLLRGLEQRARHVAQETNET